MKQRKVPVSLSVPIDDAVTELKECIARRFPTATFRVRRGSDDPGQTYIVATVDIEDPDVVMDTVLERLLEMQLDEGLPISVVPVHTPERIAETRQRIGA